MTAEDILVLLCATIIAIAGIWVNFFRKKGDAKSIQKKDRGSLSLFRFLVPLGLLSALLIYFSRFGNFGPSVWLFFTGSFFVFVGFLIRYLAIAQLGSFFTVAVATQKNQVLKTDGMYKWIRHPAYLGLLLYYFGLGLMMQNWICLLILLVFPLRAVLNRISHEEKVLSEFFGDAYAAYVKKSKKLIPWIY